MTLASKSLDSEPKASNQWHVGLVGYGEVGRILAEDLRKQDIRVSAYDIKLGGDQAAASTNDTSRVLRASLAPIAWAKVAAPSAPVS